VTPHAATATPRCRFCGSRLDHVFADLGTTPLANRNLWPSEVASEVSYPLVARVCGSCLLVQVDDSVPPEAIFTDYDYFSSTSSSWVAHAKRYCDEMRTRFGLGPHSLVVEVASNDGYLLQHFAAAGVPVLGVEPAANVATAAIAKGIPTEVAFFGADTARRLAAHGQKATLMVANNVLAHVPHIRDFVAGFSELLSGEGVATFEFPHVMKLIDDAQFDTIYHEHFFYLSLHAVEQVMASAGLRVFDVAQLPTHGGSLRLFVCHERARHAATTGLAELRAQERDRRLHSIAGYANLGDRIAATKAGFLDFLARARAEGSLIAAYGAAAKGSTFLNVCGVVHPEIKAVYDRNPVKQGKVTPGSHIPILAPERIEELRPDYLLILPWNIADEIAASLPVLRDWGGRFVTAVPGIMIF
jgi:2-polyprenyl-3-methyl-5-hydroxy-6-metoxy-1,4-benzoquinol methylase